MKMYILVHEDTPLGFAMVGVAHASLAAYLKFRDTVEVAEWLSGPFLKVVCKVTHEEYSRAAQAGDYVEISESALGGQETVLAFKPRKTWPKAFKYFQKYS